ncbi:Crp/Fnr family transcriptional regulator [Lactobacillus pasteurii]|uniref:FNR family transcriptional regulator n=1 Tax=Lactobacillus pasteurii DSM 23907 = CRBIP 24.76 TaxID=1423790 RepID=I7LE59_9LACO|nr:Crp/Fnr family transcriptional regulator [Lactobacillus pasteurii]TDG77545.1 hypothetical protein C5L33_000988 [Lactobacillus pasteurii]CCI85493.1 FNR family transcriptional regulator [Lactobacillus pasteurii DSM 23907 = CRBIP 24.76]
MEHSPLSCISQAELFKDLPLELRKQLVTVSSHQQMFKKGSLIRQPDDGNDGMMLVDHGRAKVYSIAENGKESVLEVLKTGDFEGQASLFRHEASDNFIEALEDTTICSIKRIDFQNLLQKHPEISINLLNSFGQKLTEIEKNTSRRNSLEAKDRLFAYLEDQAREQGSDSFKLTMKKKDLASYLGFTPETLSRQLKKLAAEGRINLNGKQVEIL